MKLAEERGIEACISKTPSFEYWDEMPAKPKIDSMSEYLEDVSKLMLRPGEIPVGPLKDWNADHGAVQDLEQNRHTPGMQVRRNIYDYHCECS